MENTFTVDGLSGHWHQSLTLPCGYQHFNWYDEASPTNGVFLNHRNGVRRALVEADQSDLYLYTQHEIFYQQGILKHTRSSPNWEGGLVTYATCKHLMRTYQRDTWLGVWIVGLCPKACENNCLLFAGKVRYQFDSNYDLSTWLRSNHPQTYTAKRASTNPRGDLYTPKRKLTGAERYSHNNFVTPPNHTRSVESYHKSLGSVSERQDGKVPKWWRDVEYVQRGRRPPCLVLQPCYLFSQPLLWTTCTPKRAVLRLTPGELEASLTFSPAS